MKTIAGIILVALFPILQGFAETPNASGFLVTREGKTINFTRVHPNIAHAYFKYGPEDKLTEIPFAKIAEITFGEGGKTAQVTLQNGRNLNAKPSYDSHGSVKWAKGSREPSPMFYYHYFDEVARKEEDSSKMFSKIAKIVFGKQSGNFKQCGHCKCFWPDSFLFCPHDGTKTAWANPK